MFCKLQPFMSGLCTIAFEYVLVSALLHSGNLFKFNFQMSLQGGFPGCCKKVGIEGGEELLQDATNGVDEVYFQVISFPLAIYYLLEGSHVIFAPKGSGRTQQVFI